MPPALGLEYIESNSNLGKDLTNSLKLCTLINPELYLHASRLRSGV